MFFFVVYWLLRNFLILLLGEDLQHSVRRELLHLLVEIVAGSLYLYFIADTVLVLSKGCWFFTESLPLVPFCVFLT